MGVDWKRKDKEMIEQGGTPPEPFGNLERRGVIAEALSEGWRYWGTCPLWLNTSNLSAGLLILRALKATRAIEDWKLQPATDKDGNPLFEVDLYIKKRNRP